MKILMFSSDPRVDEEGSATWRRMQEYGEALRDKLKIVKFDRKDGRWARFWKGYKEAEYILSEERFDLITAQEVEHSLIAWRLSRRFNIPWQMQIHTDIFSPYFWRESFFNKIRVLLAKFLIPRANCVRVVSERIKKSLGSRFTIHDSRLSVLPIFYPITSGGGSMREKYPGYDFYILMVGRLSREKNFHLALSAMREVIRKYPRTLLVIVGDGPERKNIEREISHGLEINVHLEGWQQNVSQYYEFSDVFLASSNYEGYGTAIMEAIGTGLPVIMTEVGVAGEIVKNGENGIIVSAGDREGIVRSIEKIIEDKEFRKMLSEGAKNTPLPYHSPEEYREKLLASWQTCRR